VRFFLDHDVPVEVARELRHEGYAVTELREVLAVRASDVEVLNYAREHGLMLITCNLDDFLSLAVKQSNPGIIILVRRRSRHVECGHLLALLKRAGESGLIRQRQLCLSFSPQALPIRQQLPLHRTLAGVLPVICGN
jgi:predicted nuclease of predicted toxin-antitoxin system